MKLPRYMQSIDRNGVVSYRYNPPQEAIDAGVVKRQQLGTAYTDAVAFVEEQNIILDEWRSEHRHLKHLSTKSTVGDLVKSYTHSLEFERLADKSKTDYAYCFKQWQHDKTAGQTLYKTKLEHLATPMCQRIYDAHAAQAVSLANHTLAAYRLLFSYAIRNGFTQHNPFTNVKRHTERPRRVTWEKEHIKAFMAVAFSRYETRSLGLIVYTAYCAAQRLGDMRMLTWDNYDVDTGVLTLEQSKRRARVSIPLPKDLQAMLKQQHADVGWQQYMMPATRHGKLTPYTLSGLARAGKAVMVEAKLPSELQMMDLRRTAITEMVECGVALTNVMAMSGHATVHSLTPYVKHTLKSATVAQQLRGMMI